MPLVKKKPKNNTVEVENIEIIIVFLDLILSVK
jgi:hypothetical protein